MKLKVLVILALVFGLCLFFSCEGPEGAPGINGEDGTPGADGVKGDKGPDGPTGPEGEEGPAGDDGVEGARGQDGERGDPGPSVRLLGEQASKAALASLAGAKGYIDAWLINGELWIWSDTDDEDALETTPGSATLEGDTEPTTGFWIKKGAIKGPQGDKGDDGDKGPTGDSADGISFATIVFDTSEVDNTITVGSETVMVGGKVKEPTTAMVKRLVKFPTDGLYKNVETINWTFEGWYDGVEKWNFDKAVEGPMTLRAKFTEPPPCNINVFGNGNGGEGTVTNTGNGTIMKAAYYIITANGTTLNDEYVLYIGHSLTEYTPHVPMSFGTAAINGVAATSQRMNLTIRGIHGQRHIQKNGNGSLFTLGAATGSNTNIKLTLDNVVLVGEHMTTISTPPAFYTAAANNAETYMTPLVLVQSGAQFIMKDGSGVTKNAAGIKRTSYPSTSQLVTAGVHIRNGSSFVMDGGEISENVAWYSSPYGSVFTDREAAGAVRIEGESSSFTMNGGLITNNSAVTSGANWYGVFAVDNGGTFIINGGEIRGNNHNPYGDDQNHATPLANLLNAAREGVIKGGITKMTGGKITGNTIHNIKGNDSQSTSSRVVYGYFREMTGGEITGNTLIGTLDSTVSVVVQFGGVNNSTNWNTNISGGTIRGNTGFDYDVVVMSNSVTSDRTYRATLTGNVQWGNIAVFTNASSFAYQFDGLDVGGWTGKIDRLDLGANGGTGTTSSQLSTTKGYWIASNQAVGNTDATNRRRILVNASASQIPPAPAAQLTLGNWRNWSNGSDLGPISPATGDSYAIVNSGANIGYIYRNR